MNSSNTEKSANRKMYYIEGTETNPAFNLALEQYAFDVLSLDKDIFMLWQNSDTVIVGLHQNTAQEINKNFIDKENIPVIRRLSGGGAVFHDKGNLNFTFITSEPDEDKIDFASSCKPIADALSEMGIPVKFSGRNDMTVEGKKFSGNARYYRDGRLMHHGTILFDVNLENLAKSLHVADDKLIAKGVKSVRSRVTNLRDYMDIDVCEFWSKLKSAMAKNLPEYKLTNQDISSINKIMQDRYATWEWNYGRSPAFSIEKRRRIEGFGTIRISMEADKGRITAFHSDGDYFGVKPYKDVASALIGTPLERNALLVAIEHIKLSDYYDNLTAEDFVNLVIT